MQALLKSTEGNGLSLVDTPVPRVGARDVLVQVRAASICGSDLPIYNWDDPWTRAVVRPGRIVGHEFCGHIVELGSQVSGLREGDFVTAEGHITCGECMCCRSGLANLCPQTELIGFQRDGAFCEYVCVPASNVVGLSDVPPEVGAIADAFGNAVHATSRAVMTGRSVLVTGCGPIGLMIIALARNAGAHRIVATDTSTYRLELAMRLGSDETIRVDAVGGDTEVREGMTDEADVLFEASGSGSALRQGFLGLRNGGDAVLIGIPKEPILFDFANDLITKGVVVHGVIGRRMFATWHQVTRYFEDTRPGGIVDTLRGLVTHQLPLRSFEHGFALMNSQRCGKVVLLPG